MTIAIIAFTSLTFAFGIAFFLLPTTPFPLAQISLYMAGACIVMVLMLGLIAKLNA